MGKNQTGPILTPAIRRQIQLGAREFLNQPLDKMTMYENIAWVMIYLATQPEGERARTELLNRLDGMQRGADVNIHTGADTKIALFWNGEATEDRLILPNE